MRAFNFRRSCDGSFSPRTSLVFAQLNWYQKHDSWTFLCCRHNCTCSNRYCCKDWEIIIKNCQNILYILSSHYSFRREKSSKIWLDFFFIFLFFFTLLPRVKWNRQKKKHDNNESLKWPPPSKLMISSLQNWCVWHIPKGCLGAGKYWKIDLKW